MKRLYLRVYPDAAPIQVEFVLFYPKHIAVLEAERDEWEKVADRHLDERRELQRRIAELEAKLKEAVE